MPTVNDLARFLREFAPTHLAAEWDNVGLLLGDGGRPVSRLMTCLTVTESVVAEAIESSVELIVSHHPILFRGAKRLSTETREGRLLLPLLEHRIAVYSPHTSFDNAPGGINDMLATKLGLSDVVPLRKRDGSPQFKIVVFVPEDDLEAVSDAMFRAGAGHIGEYRECSFRLHGTGTFFGSETTNPTVGEKGRREQVAEWRTEVICPKSALDRVLSAMREAHSYEEPAYDVYPLWSAPDGGAGRVGNLSQPMSLEKFGKKVKSTLKAGRVQLTGHQEGNIRRVALACGAAGEFLRDAVRAKADVFLTGEFRFHDGYEAAAQNIGVVVAGHYATERFAIEELAQMLATRFPDIQTWPSRREIDPTIWV